MSLPPPFAASASPGSMDIGAANLASILARVDHLGVLEFSGADGRAFLQAQLSCDVARATAVSATYGAYCTPKGRMLASFLLWQEESGYRMALSRDIVSAVHRQISRYVLRSRVKIADLSESTVLFGAAGGGATVALKEIFSSVPGRPLEVFHQAGAGSLIRIEENRFVLAIPGEAEAGLFGKLAALKRVDAAAWRRLDIRAGLPWITAATQDALVPQMANLELIGGVSFEKGCYPGQEIVARTQHLGKVKRRLYLAHSPEAARAGDALFSEDLGEQASGLVVNAEDAPDGGSDLLAVVHQTSREGSTVHLRSLDGPALAFLDMPYPV